MEPVVGVLKISPRLMNSYPVQRVAVAGATLLSSILAAHVLGAAVYGELAFFVFFTKSLLLGNLGAISGFLVHYYTQEDGAHDGAASKFHTAYTLHLLTLAAVCLTVGPWVSPVYGFAALGFTILIPFFVFEPWARIQRKFYISLIPDLVLSFTLIGGTLTYALAMYSGLTPWSVLWVALAWMLALSVCVARILRPSLGSLGVQLQQVDWQFYRGIVSIGMPRFLATCAFTVFLMLDRVFLEHFYDRTELGVYMLAFQLATGSGLLLSAQNLVSGVDIGEAIRKSQVSPELVRRLLNRSLALGATGLIGVTVFSYLLEHHFLSGYPGLSHTTFALSLGLIAFLASGNLTDLAFYKGAHRPLIIGLFAVLTAGLASNILHISIFRGSASSLANFTGTLLVLYACASVLYTRQLANSLKTSTPEKIAP